MPLNSIRGFDGLGRIHCIYLITCLPLEISLLLPLTYDSVPPAHHSYLPPHSQVSRKQTCQLKSLISLSFIMLQQLVTMILYHLTLTITRHQLFYCYLTLTIFTITRLSLTCSASIRILIYSAPTDYFARLGLSDLSKCSLP